ncbi:adenylate isopentenyltransferase-like [Zingiber officinale]|uniref:Uncharacterized protein n=1 Tax=Zingiber officinale TaxID=94328 RepID=A0A8J5G2Z8_ZINOF|nr:adenylate isopentenyltransferase-like [Zingiber officinale]KAG6490539.1 hypothetical protein ZIOFF_051837 [Zingiber officinale]
MSSHGDEDETHGEEKDRIVVIMGATGTGKSNLSIELSAAFSGEVINSDKIQVYRGLDIVTNKISREESRGVPHHLFDAFDPAAGEMSASDFQALASQTIRDIAARGCIPIVVGGSNSFVFALLTGLCDPEHYASLEHRLDELRYDGCFIWMHVDAEVLTESLDRRIDGMVERGMVEELDRYFATEEGSKNQHPGLGKAIGVSEFRAYFTGEDGRTEEAFEAALAAMKANTRELMEKQVKKIEQLASLGWPLLRMDATAAVAAKLAGVPDAAVAEALETDVVGPSKAAVARFLQGLNAHSSSD